MTRLLRDVVLREAGLAGTNLRWSRRRRWTVILIGIGLFLAIVAIFVIRPFWKLSSQFDAITFRQPSRLYARATRLFEGRSYSPDLPS